MESRAEKDAKTIAIARALGIFVLVVALATAGLYLADRLGADVLDAGFRVAVALAVSLAALFLVRHRRG